ncbi:sulfatase family protein [Aureliella helgolandensis]|uniref:Arylsulfatase n=1 Tax=Aureliella helgolandensis TaxID=2527968 RepID=A0A518G445_9BACT|nr:sulfatase [Aureliella helgolandensis]QDV23319.1 Arylsulfatase [Aureliella helgolandensis]
MRFLLSSKMASAVRIASCFFALLSTGVAVAAPPHPNIVLIFTDDLGYGDIACFSETRIRTPNIDSLAKQGTQFTDFYVAQAVCSASRAALMTGCYANRVGMAGALNHTSPTGINPQEELLPEILQAHGYATGMFGKWHLGLPPFFSPLKNGFDEWLGIPYSNDNTKYHPVLADSMPPLPLYDGNQQQGDRIVETDMDQALFTRRLTERAVEFIERNQTQPFFLYVPHVMPHVPIFASDQFRGQSNFGLYGDVIEEIDWSVGQIVETIDRLGLTDNTLVIFSSDNGPFLSYGSHAGSPGKLREGKLTTFEGGVRVPTIMRWPGKIPTDRSCSTPLMTVDLLPTVCQLIGAELPSAPLDGVDVGHVLRGDAEPGVPHESLAFYSGTELQAIRSGKWKLHFPHKYLTPREDLRTDGKPAGYGKLTPKSITESGVEGIASRHGYRVADLPLSLYDLEADPGEQQDVSSEHPQVVKRLQAIGQGYRRDLGDSLTGVEGAGVRPIGRNDQ